MIRKDLAVTWLSPIPWVGGALFHAVLGLIYVSELTTRGQALVQPLFPLAGFLLLIAVPTLTMRSMAEEARTGTLDLLQAIPIWSGRIVIAKWLAAWLTTLLLIAPSLLAVGLLHLYGNPDPGPVIAGYIGLALVAAALAGIGILASSLTVAQPVAAVLAFFACLVLWFAHVGSQVLVTGALLAHLSISERLRGFAAGVLDTGDVAYLAILVAGALVLAAVAVDARRLR